MIILSKKASIDHIIISKFGKIVIYSHTNRSLYMYSINGDLYSKINLEEEGIMPTITSITLNKDNRLLITAGGKVVVVRNMLDLLPLHQFKESSSDICSITLAFEDRLMLIATVDGKIGVYFKTNQYYLF